MLCPPHRKTHSDSSPRFSIGHSNLGPNRRANANHLEEKKKEKTLLCNSWARVRPYWIDEQMFSGFPVVVRFKKEVTLCMGPPDGFSWECLCSLREQRGHDEFKDVHSGVCRTFWLPSAKCSLPRRMSTNTWRTTVSLRLRGLELYDFQFPCSVFIC